jgi:hypothetical protein
MSRLLQPELVHFWAELETSVPQSGQLIVAGGIVRGTDPDIVAAYVVVVGVGVVVVVVNCYSALEKMRSDLVRG